MIKEKIDISVIVPVYGCKSCLLELYSRLEKSLTTITSDFEIILINDSSPDHAWPVIEDLGDKDKRVKGINLSRNFGQHYAITAGLDYACGEWVVVMDCDLQDQPEEIVKLYNKAQEGYDVVFGRRYERKDGMIKKMGSRMFYKVFDYFTENSSDNTVANFSIVSRIVVENFRTLREQNRSFPLFIRWMGFSVSYVDIEHAERHSGRSSYNFRRMFNLAIDSIVAQSNKPLRLSIKSGFIMSIISMLYAIYLVIRYFFFSVPVAGWTSVMVSIYFVAGLLLANFGLIGLYLGKVFDETKGRPLYIIKEKKNV